MRALALKFPHCAYCGRPINDPGDFWSAGSLDHGVPKARGGTRSMPNGVMACLGCNELKADMTAEEYRFFLENGRFHHDYILYLERRARDRAKGRGIHIGSGPVDAGD